MKKPVVTALGRRLKEGRLNGKRQFIKGPRIPNTIRVPKVKSLAQRMAEAYDRNRHLIPEKNRDED